MRALERLSILESALERSAVPKVGNPLRATERWLGSTADDLAKVGSPKTGLVTINQIHVRLTMEGVLSQRENGGNLPYAERLNVARELQREVLIELELERRRLLETVRQLEQTAESAIRAAATARILVAPGVQQREKWLSDVLTRMTSNTESMTQLIRLRLTMPKAEVLRLFDRVFRQVFNT